MLIRLPSPHVHLYLQVFVPEFGINMSTEIIAPLPDLDLGLGSEPPMGGGNIADDIPVALLLEPLHLPTLSDSLDLGN